MLGAKHYLGACIPRAIKGIEVSTLATVSARCISPEKGMQEYVNYLYEIGLFAQKQYCNIKGKENHSIVP